MARRRDYSNGGRHQDSRDAANRAAPSAQTAPARLSGLPDQPIAAMRAVGPQGAGNRRDGSPKATGRTSDGFDNFAANLGLGRDNLLAKSGYMSRGHVTRSRGELEDMYRSSWVVGRMVEVVAEDMVRCGISVHGGLEPDDVSLLLKAYRDTGLPGRLTDAIKWGRLYGGSLAVMLFDGQAPHTPLDMNAIVPGSFRGLYVLDRHEVTPSTETVQDLGPMLGYPAWYTIHAGQGESLRVHHSRVLRFIGVDLPGDMRRTEQHWGASVVERAYDRILALDSATHGSANLLFKSFLRVVGVSKLRDILAAGGQAEKGLLRMFAMIRQFQSNEGITLLDREDTFTTHSWNFAGIYDALQAFCEQIAGATGIPLVRLLGQSPKGFSSGESDMRVYCDTILTQLEDDKRPADAVLFNVLSRHLWGRPLPADFNFEYQSLLAPTEEEKSAIAAADSQRVVALHNAELINKDQAVAELKDASRLTRRFSNIRANSI